MNETIDTVGPLWAWIAGIVFAVVAICWAIGSECKDEFDPPSGPSIDEFHTRRARDERLAREKCGRDC